MRLLSPLLLFLAGCGHGASSSQSNEKSREATEAEVLAHRFWDKPPTPQTFDKILDFLSNPKASGFMAVSSRGEYWMLKGASPEANDPKQTEWMLRLFGGTATRQARTTPATRTEALAFLNNVMDIVATRRDAEKSSKDKK